MCTSIQSWTSSDGRHRLKRSVQDTTTHRGDDVGNNHNLQVGTARYDESKLRIPEVREQFQVELNRFSILQMTIRMIQTTTQSRGGRRSRPPTLKRHWMFWDAERKKCKSWISMESWRKIEERRKLKKKTDGARSERLKNKARKRQGSEEES